MSFNFINKIFSTYKLNRGMTHSIFTKGHPEYCRGMTYVELIVVLSIFSIMSSVVLFNHQGFQAKVDIKVLANDIALQLAEAQKNSVNGKWNIKVLNQEWKPSYGLYFDLDGYLTGAGNEQFVSFVDLNNDGMYSDLEFCPDAEEGSRDSNIECLNRVVITKDNFIENITMFTNNTGTLVVQPLSVTFKRPNTSAIFFYNGSEQKNVDYIEITISSPENISSKIQVYKSGMVRVL